MKEFTLRATLLGLLFGLFFAVANGYLALKIGQTISASIPAAIMAMGIMKTLFKKSTILEHNIVQTIATVGEGIAAGVVFTIPALIILGETPSIGRIFLLSSLGAILGILFMIPMRRFLIVQEHKKLPYPEGAACATILKAGERGGAHAMKAVWGFCTAAVYKVLTNALFLWNETISFAIGTTKFALDGTPALLGVGYIIGPSVSTVLFCGSALSWWVLIPLILYFGDGTHSADDVWAHTIRYIGAGCLATGGLLSLIRIMPLLYKTIHTGIKELFSGIKSQEHLPATARDIPMNFLFFGALITIAILWLTPTLPMNFFTIILLVVLSFLFTAVTSLTVGIVGSSSNPLSGMLITTLLITCLTFVLLGWTERLYLISAITMGCVASCTIAMAATTAQDLKTGYLVGATPRSQQIAEIFGVVLPSLALGFTIYIMHSVYTIGSHEIPAPQASLMAMVAKGVMSGDLPYHLVGIGAVLSLMLALLGVNVLAFALGVYLPLSLSTATMLGSLMRGKKDSEDGTLFASGFVGGDAVVGILIALSTILGLIPVEKPPLLSNPIALLACILLALTIRLARKKR